MPGALKYAVRGPAQEGESWPGHLLWLAGENSVAGLERFGKPFQLHPAEMLTLGPEVMLPLLTGNACVVSLSSKRFHRWRFLASFGRTFRCRICVKCWREDREPYMRSIWDQPLSLFCAKHNVLLIDTCQLCGRELDVRRRTLLRCDCGALLLDQTMSARPAWIERMVQHFIDPSDCARGATFAAACGRERQAARFLGRLAMHSRGEVELLDRGPRIFDCFVPSKDVQSLGQWFRSWPRDFFSRLEDARASMNTDAIWHNLNARFHLSQFSDFARAIRAGTTQARIDRRRVELKETYGMNDLIRATRHSHNTIRRWFKAGLFPPSSVTIEPETGAILFAVPRALFVHIERAYRSVANVREAAEILGCSERTVLGLIHCGALRSVKAPIVDRCFLIKRRSLSLFKRRLFKMAHKCSRGRKPDERLIFCDFVSATHQPRGRRWRRALDAVDRGLLPLYASLASPTRLNDIVAFRSDLQRCGFIRVWSQ